MQPFNTEIDQITQDVSSYAKRIFDEYAELNLELKSDYSKSAVWISFHLGCDYFLSARDTLEASRLLGGGAIVRTCIENIADLFYIFASSQKEGKRAKAYVESLETFRQKMIEITKLGSDAVFEARMAKQVNDWTTSTITDRMKVTGQAMTTIYDFLSYSSHPNPGALSYLLIPGFKKAQQNLLQQVNCTVMLHLISHVLMHDDLKSVTLEEADAVARRLGSKVLPDGER
ncbi:MAG: hypothetical protein JWN01_484 [Patescibacteria group bacterium]|nr:hypothetical protein [Patescibacteria group bacterium]